MHHPEVYQSWEDQRKLPDKGMMRQACASRFACHAGASVVQIVFSESSSFNPLRSVPRDVDATTILFSALQNPKVGFITGTRAKRVTELSHLSVTRSVRHGAFMSGQQIR